ncbi:alpha-L-rhamnosidase [Beduini massiliensis]|uniref:alpha-L-rhamnosidase n=1 Tax=Beduini massiliensis TaxID=1585974 RepID=UPI0006933FA9|nr:alpha-L-rhamnosidase [Beduini massiliensis]
MKISHVRINHLKNPVGYDFSHLSITWQVQEEKAKKIIWSRIQIALDEQMDQIVYDTDKTELEALGTKIKMDILPYTRYYVQVTAMNDLEGTAKSEVSYFETAKLNDSWQARFITPQIDEPSILFKDFSLTKKVCKARLYICGLGLYEAYLNGQFVNGEYLMPGFHSYDDYLQYQTYDVTHQLQTGDNHLEVALGNGWYKGRMGFDGGYTKIYGDQYALILELHVTFEDGTKTVVLSDHSFKRKPSPILDQGIYDGETYDSRLEKANQVNDVDYLDMDTTKLSERYSMPIHIIEKRSVQEVIYTKKDEIILDFGQNITGWVEFVTDQDLILSYSETMQDGCFYNANYRESNPYFTFISDGKERSVRPHFTFYGFRYVKVEGIKEVNAANFTACLISSDLDQTGYLRTGNAKVNRLIANAYYSQRDNFLDVPTDCPQRDERLGWTGDAQIFAGTASFNLDTAGFYRKYLRDMLAEQRRLGGSVPFTVPMLKPKIENFVEWPNKPKEMAKRPLMMLMGHGASPWSDAAAIIPWTLYQYYGDKVQLEENYTNMKMFVDYVIGQDQLHGHHHLYDFGFHFADWLALDNKAEPDSPFGATDIHFVASMFYYYSTTLLKEAAEVLGYQEDQIQYHKKAQLIKQAIRDKYIQAGHLTIDTQTGLVLGLKFDLFNKEEFVINSQRLIEKLKENNMHLDTGFVGTPYLAPVLSKIGHDKEAYQLLLNEEYPGWLYEVNLGATTIWERWNSVLEDGSMNPQGMNSLNHYAYGSIVEWIYRYAAGLQQIKPGFKEVEIKPIPHPDLGYCDMRYQSASGEYKIKWEYQEPNSIHYDITVPFGCTAHIFISGLTKQSVMGGTYHYEVKL